MTICCDVDGVLNNLMDVVVDIFNERYGTAYVINDITTYDLANCLTQTVATNMKEIFTDSEIWSRMKPINGAQEGLKKLVRNGHQVYLVTNNAPHTFGAKVDWIQHYFPFIESSKIICMKDKWLFKCDAMIEDCYETLIANPCYDRVLVNQPWNQSDKDWVYNIHRCSTWDEIIDVVNKINDEE